MGRCGLNERMVGVDDPKCSYTDSEMEEADRASEYVEIAEVVYSVPTSPRYEVGGRPDKLRSCKAIGMLVVEAGVRIRFGRIHGYYSHWRMREGQVVI